MNLIHSEKVIWILPERTASRAIGQLLNFWDVQTWMNPDEILPKNFNDGEFSQHMRHDWRGAESYYPEYDLIIAVRNPYSRMLSYYKSLFLKLDCKDKECGYSFTEFLEKIILEGNLWTTLNFDEMLRFRKPKHVVKTESLKIDLMNIPMIEKKFRESQDFRETWRRIITENKFTKESKENSSQISEHDAKLIYRTFKDQFDMFGYSEDSWRYL